MYNNLTLFLLGFAGVLLHNLIKMQELNKLPEHNFTLIKYLKAEIYTIIISLLVVVVCIIAKTEIKKLESVSDYLGLGFVAIGYMGQSILVKFIGKAEKIIQ